MCLKRALHTGTQTARITVPSFHLNCSSKDRHSPVWTYIMIMIALQYDSIYSLTLSPILIIHVCQRQSWQGHFCRVFCIARGLHVDGEAGETLTVFLWHRAPLPAAKEKLHLLSEEAGGQGVEDGVKSTVDWKNENHHPGVYCPCRDKHRAFMLTTEELIALIILNSVIHWARCSWVIFRNKAFFHLCIQ